MIPRQAEKTLRELARGYPVIGITGPRQSGKSTLARHVFADKPYISLENPDDHERAQDDPRGFLAAYPDGAVFDEAQRCPHLFSYLQGLVDADPRPGRFVLTGSQQFGLLAGVTQSLAGRIALVQLLPFSFRECYRSSTSLDDVLFTGLYPPVHDRALNPSIWYANYLQTYIERDVRQLVNVRDLSVFQRFVRLCAGRSGQLLNLSNLAADAGINANTARAWISILEASYIVYLLQPHHQNFNKRLIKTPKLYFCDPGLAVYLLTIRDAAQLNAHAQRGALFETFIVGELLKARYNQGLPADLYFWRDRSGHEIDLLVQRGDGLQPIEIKSGQTLNRDFFKGLHRWLRLAGPAAVDPVLVYGGSAEAIHQGIRVVPWHSPP